MFKSYKIFNISSVQIYVRIFFLTPNTFLFSICWALFVRTREKLSQCYIQKSFLVIGDFKKIWNCAIVFDSPSIAPPFPPIQYLPVLARFLPISRPLLAHNFSIGTHAIVSGNTMRLYFLLPMFSLATTD